MDKDALQILSILSNTLGQYTIILLAMFTGALALYSWLITTKTEEKNGWLCFSLCLTFVVGLFSFFALVQIFNTNKNIAKKYTR